MNVHIQKLLDILIHRYYLPIYFSTAFALIFSVLQFIISVRLVLNLDEYSTKKGLIELVINYKTLFSINLTPKQVL